MQISDRVSGGTVRHRAIAPGVRRSPARAGYHSPPASVDAAGRRLANHPPATAEHALQRFRTMLDPFERAKAIRAVVFDVDGVLTDGSLFLGDDGQEYKAFHSRDGHGMVMLRDSGVTLAIITGRRSEVVRLRMESLGIEHVHQGCRDKLPAYEGLKQALGTEDAQMAYVGDDVVDLPLLRRAGLAVAVADAHPLVLEHAHWRTPHPGGRGAARDVCELILRAQGKLDAMLAAYL
jgi:3-deoxy-D-manno-octulosonate 8-phosphate phosphatase (KDO 8-P phosphatase)